MSSFLAIIVCTTIPLAVNSLYTQILSGQTWDDDWVSVSPKNTSADAWYDLGGFTTADEYVVTQLMGKAHAWFNDGDDGTIFGRTFVCEEYGDIILDFELEMAGVIETNDGALVYIATNGNIDTYQYVWDSGLTEQSDNTCILDPPCVAYIKSITETTRVYGGDTVVISFSPQCSYDDENIAFGNISVTCTATPTTDPTTQPTSQTLDPTIDPTKDPTDEPTKDPTMEPSFDPTDEPTEPPTFGDPTADPSIDPTADPTMEPTQEPTSLDPTDSPTPEPTDPPTGTPNKEGGTKKDAGDECDFGCKVGKALADPYDGGWPSRHIETFLMFLILAICFVLYWIFGGLWLHNRLKHRPVPAHLRQDVATTDDYVSPDGPIGGTGTNVQMGTVASPNHKDGWKSSWQKEQEARSLQDANTPLADGNENAVINTDELDVAEPDHDMGGGQGPGSDYQPEHVAMDDTGYAMNDNMGMNNNMAMNIGGYDPAMVNQQMMYGSNQNMYGSGGGDGGGADGGQPGSEY